MTLVSTRCELINFLVEDWSHIPPAEFQTLADYAEVHTGHISHMWFPFLGSMAVDLISIGLLKAEQEYWPDDRTTGIIHPQGSEVQHSQMRRRDPTMTIMV